MLLRNTLDSSHSFHSSTAIHVVTTATTLAQFHHNNSKIDNNNTVSSQPQRLYATIPSTYSTMILDID